MYEFDSRLCALAGCPVITGERGGMLFNPNPVITAENDLYLAHEICHVLAGREDFEIFISALHVRNDDEMFRHVLNMLYDWYHESLYSSYSGFLYGKLNALHETMSYKPAGIEVLDNLYRSYLERNNIIEELDKVGIIMKDAIDLVVMADYIIEKLSNQMVKLGIDIDGVMKRLLGAGRESDINVTPKRSSYYISAVSKYLHTINDLTKLWKKNRYSWINNYYGEIDWKNLPGMFFGESLNLPVWRLFQKIAISRKVYLVIDRSGSTDQIKELIMDTAIIIAESLRMLNIPISILDVGVTDSVVNDIESPLDLPWFTPMSVGGTPLGEVCSLITNADCESHLLIVTDGQPHSWETLNSALNAFPGTHLAFVIGDSYGDYLQKTGNAIHVEPHTIIREMLYEPTLT